MERQARDDKKNDFNPQTYEQLATVLHRSGQHAEAKKVLINQQEKRTEIMKAVSSALPEKGKHKVCEWLIMNFPTRVRLLWRYLLREAMGYGYQPLQLFAWSLGIVAAGCLFFWLGDFYKLITPNERMAEFRQKMVKSEIAHCIYNTNEWLQDTSIEGLEKRKIYPSFNPFVYSLETFVPVVNLGKRAYW